MATKKFTKQQTAEYKKLFKKYDCDGGGKITASELGSVMASLGRNLSRAELQAIIDSVDKDGSKSMDFNEFMEWMEKKVVNAQFSEEIMEEFKRHDLNSDGLISPEEIREVVRVKGERLCNAEVDVMISQLDMNEDGKVNYIEFARMMMD